MKMHCFNRMLLLDTDWKLWNWLGIWDVVHQVTEFSKVLQHLMVVDGGRDESLRNHAQAKSRRQVRSVSID